MSPSWRGIYSRRHTYPWDKYQSKEWDWRMLYEREAEPDLLTKFYFSAKSDSFSI